MYNRLSKVNCIKPEGKSISIQRVEVGMTDIQMNIQTRQKQYAPPALRNWGHREITSISLTIVKIKKSYR